MRARRGMLVGLAVAVAAAGVMTLGGVGAARVAKPKTVNLYDDYFTPTDLKVRKGGRVRWLWTNVVQGHNVTLTRAPKRVKKSRFRSQTTADPSYRFTRRFKKPGRYRFDCTLHYGMKMSVVVKKPPRA